MSNFYASKFDLVSQWENKTMTLSLTTLGIILLIFSIAKSSGIFIQGSDPFIIIIMAFNSGVLLIVLRILSIFFSSYYGPLVSPRPGVSINFKIKLPCYVLSLNS